MAGELESMLIRKGIDEMSASRHSCSRCLRTPLPGERLHRFESGRLLCDLCLARLPKDQRSPISSERIRVGARLLRIARPAA
jgi:hypothetical protein